MLRIFGVVPSSRTGSLCKMPSQKHPHLHERFAGMVGKECTRMRFHKSKEEMTQVVGTDGRSWQPPRPLAQDDADVSARVVGADVRAAPAPQETWHTRAACEHTRTPITS
mmetsp:Transcript_51302/g.104352  ORF Transcript_51302/g.104352 Transcript_51302/m.104352 type:complete len:110 (-) Transcript_51302:101-430(-)